MKEVQSKDAGRRTGTGSEVWYDRDELARDSEVLHPHWVMLYKSGVYASKVACLTPGGLPYAETSRLRLTVRLKGEQSTLTVWQESAEGIVGVGNEPLNKGEVSPHRRPERYGG